MYILQTYIHIQSIHILNMKISPNYTQINKYRHMHTFIDWVQGLHTQCYIHLQYIHKFYKHASIHIHITLYVYYIHIHTYHHIHKHGHTHYNGHMVITYINRSWSGGVLILFILQGWGCKKECNIPMVARRQARFPVIIVYN